MIELNENIIDNWIAIIGERGYVGSRGKQVKEELDERFGEDNWSKAHYFDGELFSKREAIEIYENAYFEFLRDNTDVLEWLVNTASEVYDIAPSNIDSGLDYSIQECKANHFQDISIRRSLIRLGKEFKGDHLIQIRGHQSEGYTLNPGQVPFHKPELMLPGKDSWWKRDSIEAFYQNNKVLLTDPDKLLVNPQIQTPNGEIIYAHTKKDYYQMFENNPKVLIKIKGNVARRKMQEDKNYKKLPNQPQQPYSHFLQNVA